jgi:hypothetical protein
MLNQRQLLLLAAIDALLQKVVHVFNTSDGGLYVLRLILSCWKIGLKQVVRLETDAFRSSDPPFNSLAYENREKFGLYLHKKAELCYGIFNTQAKLGGNTTLLRNNFAQLWAETVAEERRWEIANGVFSINEDIARRMEQIKSLKKFNNPYAPDNPEWQYSFNLFEAATDLGKARKRDSRDVRRTREFFRDLYYYPCISAFQVWTQELRKFQLLSVDRERGDAGIDRKRTKGKPAREIIYPKPNSPRRLGGRGIKP